MHKTVLSCEGSSNISISDGSVSVFSRDRLLSAFILNPIRFSVSAFEDIGTKRRYPLKTFAMYLCTVEGPYNRTISAIIVPSIFLLDGGVKFGTGVCYDDCC